MKNTEIKKPTANIPQHRFGDKSSQNYLRAEHSMPGKTLSEIQ